jgi:YVTN family beta-propeller protein
LESEEKVARAYALNPGKLVAGGTLGSFEASASSMTIPERGERLGPHIEPTILPEARMSRKLGVFLAILTVILLVIPACDQQSSGSSGSEDKAEAKDLPDYVAAEISVGSGPEMVAAGFGSIWVSVKHEQIVARIAPKTNKVVAKINPPHIPCVVNTGFGSVWQSLCEDQGLVRIDPETNKIVAKIDEALIAPQGAFGDGSVWGTFGDHVVRVDPQTNKVTEIPLDVAPFEVTYGGETLWVLSVEAGSVLRIDPETHKVVARIPVPTDASTIGIPDFAAGSFWVAISTNGTVVRIDPEANKVVARIKVGGYPYHLDATSDGVWVKRDPRTLVRIDPETNRVAQEMKVPAGEYAGDVVAAYDSVWSANWDEGSVWRIDPDGK